jgi:transcriptional regulator with XRE-family HTH domain
MSRIRECREILGLSQWQFANLSGIERSRISLAECNHVNLTPEEIGKVKSAVLRALEHRTEQFQAVLAQLEAPVKEEAVSV